MLPGETVASGAPTKCNDEGCPGADGPKVCRSAAGYYVGYQCNMCGPYSRESGYFATSEEAEKAIGDDTELRDSSFNPSSLEITSI